MKDSPKLNFNELDSGTAAHKYKKSRSMYVVATTPHRDAIDVKRVNDFLRLLISNH